MNIKLFTTLGVGVLLVSSVALADGGPGGSQALIMEQQKPLVRVKHHKPETTRHVIHHHKGWHRTPSATTVKHKNIGGTAVTRVKHSPGAATVAKHKGKSTSY